MKFTFSSWTPVGMAGMALAGFLTGCVALEDTRSEQAAAGREDQLLLQEDLRRVSGRLEGMDLELTRLQSQVDTLRASQGRAGQTEIQALQARLADLETRLRASEAAREKDKQEIVESLSKKISQIVAPPASSSKSASKSGTRSNSGPSSGYEHIVASGDTLSTIAAAYGVSVKVILEDNDIKDPNRLRVGQKLFIRD